MTLNDYLKTKDMRPAAFAALLHVPSSTVTRWLTGARMPRAEALQDIERITEGSVTLNDFVAANKEKSHGAAA